MTAAPTEALRLAVEAEGGLDAEACEALAAVLLRTGVGLRVVPKGEAEVVLRWGSPPEAPPAVPTLVVPRAPRGRWESEAGRVFVDLADGDLPTAAGAILSGKDEARVAADAHGRPAPRGAFAARHGLLDTPFVDTASRRMGIRLASLVPRPLPRPSSLSVALTFDIDSAGLFSGWRARARAFRTNRLAARRGFLPRLGSMAATMAGLRKDPHLAIRELAEALEGLDTPATFFVQARRAHRLDNYTLRTARGLAREVHGISRNGFHAIGLHSSYATADQPPRFLREQWRELARCLGRRHVAPVHRSHYLRFLKPDGELSIGHPGPVIDSSLAYGAVEGFRRGTAIPFLLGGRILEAPPSIMDSTLLFHRKDDPGSALGKFQRHLEAVREAGGVFIPIWHPHLLNGLEYPGWRDVLYDLVYDARAAGHSFQLLADAVRPFEDRLHRLREGLKRNVP